MQILRKVEYVAPRLNMTKQRVYELVRIDFFPTGVVVRFGRQVRFNEKLLVAFLEGRHAETEGSETDPAGSKRASFRQNE